MQPPLSGGFSNWILISLFRNDHCSFIWHFINSIHFPNHFSRSIAQLYLYVFFLFIITRFYQLLIHIECQSLYIVYSLQQIEISVDCCSKHKHQWVFFFLFIIPICLVVMLSLMLVVFTMAHFRILRPTYFNVSFLYLQKCHSFP